ncbi:MAG TPA: hypothetical protein VJN62_00075 [Gemmatimonadales bacterium]|nr:hypothetical protein [Gemmatimonadales bacterium]
MDPYTFALALGGLGLLVMGASGLGHRLHPGGQVGHGHGHHHGVMKAGGKGHAVQHGAQHAHPHGLNVSIARVSRVFLTILSPRVAFSLILGFGATGFLLKNVFGGALLIAFAAVGGAAFEAILVRPLFNFLSKFASDPALTLDATLGDEVQVVTGFDAQGQGLVSVELNGQIVQLLGTLTPEDRSGPKVHAGDTLFVKDVDSARHRVVVGRTQD